MKLNFLFPKKLAEFRIGLDYFLVSMVISYCWSEVIVFHITECISSWYCLQQLEKTKNFNQGNLIKIYLMLIGKKKIDCSYNKKFNNKKSKKIMLNHLINMCITQIFLNKNILHCKTCNFKTYNFHAFDMIITMDYNT